MPTSKSKPVPLTEDEACTWLSFATIESAEVIDGTLHLLRDDGARLAIKPDLDETSAPADPVLAFEAEGATV